MILSRIIINLGILLLFVNTFLFTISYFKKDKCNTYFMMYLLLCLFIQLYSSILFLSNKNNLFLGHYFFIGQFLLLSFFYAKLLDTKKLTLGIQLLIPIIGIPFFYYYFKFPEKLNQWNEIEIAVTSILLLIYSFLFFMQKITSVSTKKYIYFNAGFFIYTLCSTLLFTLGNIGSRQLKLVVWDLNAFLYVVFQILIFVEWYKNFRKKDF